MSGFVPANVTLDHEPSLPMGMSPADSSVPVSSVGPRQTWRTTLTCAAVRQLEESAPVHSSEARIFSPSQVRGSWTSPPSSPQAAVTAAISAGFLSVVKIEFPVTGSMFTRMFHAW